MIYTDEQKAEAAHAVVQHARSFLDGRGDWDAADEAMGRMLKVAGVKPQDISPFVSDRSMRRWFDGWPVSGISLETWEYHEPAVYFISTDEGRQVKIGTTRCLRRRLAVLRSNMPTPLRLEAAFPGTYDRERQLHRIFKADRIRGEWFHRSPELEGFIGRMASAFGVAEK